MSFALLLESMTKCNCCLTLRWGFRAFQTLGMNHARDFSSQPDKSAPQSNLRTDPNSLHQWKGTDQYGTRATDDDARSSINSYVNTGFCV